jgi:hypothetical protein
MTENRRYPRKDIKLNIEIDSEQEELIDAAIVDLSISGAKIDINADLEELPHKGQTIYIQGAFPESIEIIEANIEWAVKTDNCVSLGVKFVQDSLSDELFDIIKKTISD